MFETRTHTLTRDQIAEVIGPNIRAVRVIEQLVADVSGTLPEYLAQLQTQVLEVAGRVEALTQTTDDDRRETEPARMQALAAQLQQLQETMPAPPWIDGPADLAVQVAQLREQVAALPMKPKRVIPGSISLTGLSGTFTVSPAITGIAQLAYLGTSTSDTGSNLAASMVSISLSGSTVTASRNSNGPGVTATVNFVITEWPQ